MMRFKHFLKLFLFVCGYAAAQPITVSTDTYSVEELIEDVLINSPCAQVSNITWSTGTDFNSTNGIGYFQQAESDFFFEDGIILSTGNALLAPGPTATNDQGEGAFNWPGDEDLSDILEAEDLNSNTINATIIEFDFTTQSDAISFNVVFASEEYGPLFQCTYSDAFAFILTNLDDGTTSNLAVIPGTDIPVSVLTIRDNAYNANCSSENVVYFAEYYNGTDAASANAEINFRG